MIDSFFEELSGEIYEAVSERAHPFRFITMATVGSSTTARLRTVVLREVTKELKLSIYTDSRTEKINHISENDQVSFLLYHPEKLLQLKIEGTAEIVMNPERITSTWNNIPSNNKKDYITHKPPGSSISNPENVEYIEDHHFFTIIDITPSKIEYLKLKRPNHIRAVFTIAGNSWNGEFLVP
jgi:pyridoxamine 5'-phosphate oxidase